MMVSQWRCGSLVKLLALAGLVVLAWRVARRVPGRSVVTVVIDIVAVAREVIAGGRAREWARREAARLPPFTSVEVRRLTLLSRRLDAG